MRSLMGTLHDTGRATKSPRASSYGEDPRALPAIPDQLNALGLTTIPEDGLASLGSQLLPVTAIVQHPLSQLHCLHAATCEYKRVIYGFPVALLHAYVLQRCCCKCQDTHTVADTVPARFCNNVYSC